MNLKQLATGVVSGYLSKAVQLIASVVVVPFLLDPDVLGVEEYGRAFTILGATSLVGILVAGIHLSAERSIARAVGRERAGERGATGDVLGSTTKILFLACLAFVLPLALFGDRMLAGLAVPIDASHRLAILAALAIAVGENGLYLLRAPLIARGDIAYVNLVGMVEAVARTTATFVLFSRRPGSAALVLGLQAAFTFARQLAFACRLERTDRAAFVRAPLSSARDAIEYAGPVSLAEGTIILVRNAPVLVASRFLGAVEAGWVAVVANTLQGYFLQVFYSVVHPIAVPIASRFSLADVRSGRRTIFMDVEALFVFGVTLVFGLMVYWTPVAIPLWLGRDFSQIVPATQIMLVGTGIQTGAILRRAVLIGQGSLTRAVPAIVGSALVSSALIALGVVVFDSWNAAIVFSAGYLVASSSLGVDRIFARSYAVDVRSGAIARLGSVGLVYAACAIFSRAASIDEPLASVGWSIVALAVSFVLGGGTIISPSRALALGRRLYHSRGIDLFE